MSQSNFGIENIMKSYVLQLLCSNNNYEDNLLEKLYTASGLIDITPMEGLIPYNIWNKLIDEHKKAQTNLPIMFFNHKSKPFTSFTFKIDSM